MIVGIAQLADNPCAAIPPPKNQTIDKPIVRHDPRICGINYESHCPACRLARESDWLQRYPALAQPAPGSHNEIAGSFEEQFARVFKPRPARPLSEKSVKRLVATIQAHCQELRPVLLGLLAEDIGQVVAEVVKHELKKRSGTRTRRAG